MMVEFTSYSYFRIIAFCDDLQESKQNKNKLLRVRSMDCKSSLIRKDKLQTM